MLHSVRDFKFKVIFFAGIFGICAHFLACDAPKPKKPIVPTTEVIELAPIVPQKVAVKKCEEYVKTLPQLVLATESVQDSAKILSVQIESNKIIDEVSLAKWVFDFANDVFLREECSACDRILFTANTGPDSYFQGIIHRRDHELFVKKTISLPEFVRRFEIKGLDTKVSLLKKLKDARLHNDHEKALALVEKLLDLEADNPDYLTIRANVYLDQEVFFEAITLYQNILEMYPTRVDALFNLAYAQKEIGRFGDAIESFARLLMTLKASPEKIKKNLFSHEDVLLQLADAYVKNNQLTEAEKYLAEIKTEDFDYLMLKANVLRGQKRYEEARFMIQKIIDQGNAQALTWFNLVLVNLDMQDLIQARAAFMRLKELDVSLAKEVGFLETVQIEDTKSVPVVENDDNDPIESDEKNTEAAVITESTEQKTQELDLPYKPVDFPEDPYAQNNDNTSETVPVSDTEETEVPKIDWSKIPVIPSKQPALKKSPDPEV